MNRKIKGVLICGILGFLVGYILLKNLTYAGYFGAISIIIFLLIDSGEVGRFFKYLENQDKRRREDRLAWEREQARLKRIREEEREKEIGRIEAEGEHARREHEKARRERARAEQMKRTRAFLNNPLGIGR